MEIANKRRQLFVFVTLILVSILVRFVPAHAASLSQENLAIAEKQSVKLSLSGASGTVRWSSSDSEIAEVKKGTVTGKKAGTCSIYAADKSGTYVCSVTVNKILGTSATDLTLVGKGKKAALDLYFGAYSPYSWRYSLDKASVLEITEKGWGSGSRSAYYSFNLKALKSGVANLTFTNTKNSEKITVVIHVQVPEMNPASLELEKGKTAQLMLFYATASAVKWKSSNKSIVYVNKTGKIRAKKNGTAVITATYMKKKYTCQVTVKDEDRSKDVTISIMIPKEGQKNNYCTLNVSNKTGKIKAKKNGTAVITATYMKKKYTCNVTVKDEDRSAGVTISVVIPKEGQKNNYCTLNVNNKTGKTIKVNKNAFFESNFVMKKCWTDKGTAIVIPNNSSRTINYFRCKTASKRHLAKYNDMVLSSGTVVANVKVNIGSHVYRYNLDGFGVFQIEKLK